NCNQRFSTARSINRAECDNQIVCTVSTRTKEIARRINRRSHEFPGWGYVSARDHLEAYLVRQHIFFSRLRGARRSKDGYANPPVKQISNLQVVLYQQRIVTRQRCCVTYLSFWQI